MDVDFVVMWVDGNDPEWIAQKSLYQSSKKDDSNSSYRFRDWDLMRYWFRAVEKYCPWVNNIYFVTFGHFPKWLNLDCPKLHLVKHTDFIGEEYLPTFNANAIEMNIHRIEGLSDRFVLFNDDMFVLRPLDKDVFFYDDLPCTYASEIPVQFVGTGGIWQHLIVNDMRTINNHFDKREQVSIYRKKYRSSLYSWKDNVRTRILETLYPEHFLGFKNLHAPAPFLKRTFEIIWEKENELLTQTTSHKFRTENDVNQWLSIWWQVAEGSFSPGIIDNLVEDINDENIDKLCSVIKKQSHDMICLNDSSDSINFDNLKKQLSTAFESILSESSIFEK